jgi:aminoglycoside/choline kinase family phosphotransferase
MDHQTGRDTGVRDRATARDAFLNSAGWGNAVCSDLAGDASNRRYFRLADTKNQLRAVLMDAPREKGEDVGPFVQIAEHLRQVNLSAPSILAQDQNLGFLLLEDLGDDLFARVLQDKPNLENKLYSAAIDVLIDLHSAPLPVGMETYSPDKMVEMSALVFDWYMTGALSSDTSNEKAKFATTFRSVLNGLNGWNEVLVQRDYHAENLLWLPQRKGSARVGLLDFQDAMVGHRAYDLVSLLQDARRDVSPEIESEMISRYLEATRLDAEQFKRDYVLLGLQRNLRIVGVFSRLCLRDGKSHYVDLIPRVWEHVQKDLLLTNSPELVSVLACLPEPNADVLSKLRSQCGTKI